MIWFTAMFTTLGFLRNAMHVDETVAQMVVGAGAAIGCRLVRAVWAIVGPQSAASA